MIQVASVKVGISIQKIVSLDVGLKIVHMELDKSLEKILSS